MKKLKKNEKEDLCLLPPLSETRTNLFSFAKRKLDYINSFIFYVFSPSSGKFYKNNYKPIDKQRFL